MENVTSKIIEQYRDYILTHTHRPASVFKFMKENLNADESVFYTYFSSFTDLEQSIWSEQLASCIQNMETETVYQDYSVREKLLALYYTLIEEMKCQRSYAKCTLFNEWWDTDYTALKKFKEKFEIHTQTLINEGVNSGEIIERMFMKGHYQKILWWQMIFLLKFWVNDDSKSFEKTDVAVEKSVNLMMDALGENVADSTFDFIKFMVQNKI